MKVTIVTYNAVAAWKWSTSTDPHKIHRHAEPDEDDDDDDDVCGICQQAYESTCPECKVPGDDCPLSTSTTVPPAPYYVSRDTRLEEAGRKD